MLDDYQDLIDELLSMPGLVRTVIAAGDEAPPAATLALVSAVHERDKIVLGRLQRLTRETTPSFRELPSLDQAIAAAPATGDLQDFVGTFDTSRGDLVSLLMNLTLRDWERVANDDVAGEVTLAEEVERHVDFDEAVRARLTQ